jgi:hypothetical protein
MALLMLVNAKVAGAVVQEGIFLADVQHNMEFIHLAVMGAYLDVFGN